MSNWFWLWFFFFAAVATVITGIVTGWDVLLFIALVGSFLCFLHAMVSIIRETDL